jgi:hypothetical protein
MSNLINAGPNIDNSVQRPPVSTGRFSHDCLSADQMLRTPGLIGLPRLEIGPVGRRLIFKHRERDAALDVPLAMFEAAYVCALLDIESFVGQPIYNDDAVGRAIDFIEEARRSRVHDPLVPIFDWAGNLLRVYGRPTIAQARDWRTRNSRSQLVADHRFSDLDQEGISDRDGLLYAIGGKPIWLSVWATFAKAFAECLHSLDPSIEPSSTDAEIWPAIRRVSLEQRMRTGVTPSTIRHYL